MTGMLSLGQAGKELILRPAMQKATTSAAKRMNVDGRKFFMMFYILMRAKYGRLFFVALAK